MIAALRAYRPLPPLTPIVHCAFIVLLHRVSA